MNRGWLIDTAMSQLESARCYRRQAVICAMAGEVTIAKAYWAYAHRCVQVAKLFQADAQEIEIERLHLKRTIR